MRTIICAAMKRAHVLKQYYLFITGRIVDIDKIQETPDRDSN